MKFPKQPHFQINWRPVKREVSSFFGSKSRKDRQRNKTHIGRILRSTTQIKSRLIRPRQDRPSQGKTGQEDNVNKEMGQGLEAKKYFWIVGVFPDHPWPRTAFNLRRSPCRVFTCSEIQSWLFWVWIFYYKQQQFLKLSLEVREN